MAKSTSYLIKAEARVPFSTDEMNDNLTSAIPDENEMVDHAGCASSHPGDDGLNRDSGGILVKMQDRTTRYSTTFGIFRLKRLENFIELGKTQNRSGCRNDKEYCVC